MVVAIYEESSSIPEIYIRTSAVIVAQQKEIVTTASRNFSSRFPRFSLLFPSVKKTRTKKEERREMKTKRREKKRRYSRQQSVSRPRSSIHATAVTATMSASKILHNNARGQAGGGRVDDAQAAHGSSFNYENEPTGKGGTGGAVGKRAEKAGEKKEEERRERERESRSRTMTA